MTACVLLAKTGCAFSAAAVLPQRFSSEAPDAQAIDIERRIGDAIPEQMLICIDGEKVASLRKDESVRVYLSRVRAHDVYLVTRGVTNCDVNQVATVISIPTTTPVWNVGVMNNDTIKILRGIGR